MPKAHGRASGSGMLRRRWADLVRPTSGKRAPQWAGWALGSQRNTRFYVEPAGLFGATSPWSFAACIASLCSGRDPVASSRAVATADDDQAICRAAGRAGGMFGLAPEAAFTPTQASPRVEYWRQLDSAQCRRQWPIEALSHWHPGQRARKARGSTYASGARSGSFVEPHRCKPARSRRHASAM